MSRFGGRHSTSDLAYGDEEPQRWDRERFERFRSRAPPVERETIRISERDSPRRSDVRIEERERDVRRGPKSHYDEKDFDFFEEERYGPPARVPRRSDRELFGEADPRDVGERSLAPYRRKSIVEREIDINRFSERAPPPRPGLLRRQSSLDTFDRKPVRREREEYRLPPNVPIPLPRRREASRRGGDYEDFEDIQYREYSPHGYRDVEIMREKSRVRKRDRAKSDLRSISTRSSSASTESFEKISRHSSPSPERKVGKKGKTKMPRRLVRKEAIIELGYPFEEEEDFIIVRRALEKEQIDEVIRISENYKGPTTRTYRFEETLEAPPPPPVEHYESQRTEWINPPSVRAPSVRAPSPARSTRTRRSSPARTVRAPSPPPPQPIYIQQPAPPPVRETIYIQQQAPAPQPLPPQPPQQPMTLVLPERSRHNDRDIRAEIEALEAEQRALRYERNLVVRRPEEYEVVEYKERRPEREMVEYVERPRERSPKREIVRVEKDRKEERKKKPNARIVAAMMSTLT